MAKEKDHAAEMKRQASNSFKKFIAFGSSRANTKRRDNTSAGFHSVRTYNEAVGALAHAAKEMGVSRIKHITEDMAILYLLNRHISGLSSKTLSRDRAALSRILGKRLPFYQELHHMAKERSLLEKWVKQNKHSTAYTDKQLLDSIKTVWKETKSMRLGPIKDGLRTHSATRKHTEKPLREITRAYSDQQIAAIAKNIRSEHERLAVLIARDAGLRTKEIITLRRVGEGLSETKQRDWRSDRHIYKGESISYLVTGKGGLVRTVKIKRELAERLELLRHSTPKEVNDRGVNYTQYYDLVGGQKLSAIFTKTSIMTLGYSNGVHGLRHSYAHRRMDFLLARGISFNNAKHITSQELGHMRMKITDTYLR